MRNERENLTVAHKVKRELSETEAAINHMAIAMNHGDETYWPGKEITVHPLDGRGYCLPAIRHVVTAAEYAVAAKRAAGEV